MHDWYSCDTSMKQVNSGGFICILTPSCIHKNELLTTLLIIHAYCTYMYLRVNFSPIACCLSDPGDPGESPNRLLLPIRIDWSTALCQTRSMHHSFNNKPCSFAVSSFPASLYFHFIIISQSESMQANRPTVNHTTIKAKPNLLVDSFSSTAASK